MSKTFQNRQLGTLEKIKDTFDKINTNGDELSADLSDLYGQIAAIVAGDSNATIGVYPGSDVVNTNNYTVSPGVAARFDKFRIEITVANQNTGNVTLDDDGRGAKPVKRYNLDGSLRELRPGEFTHALVSWSVAEDCWILLVDATVYNKESGYFDPNIFVGNTKLGDDFQDESAWSLTAGTASKANDTSVKLLGKSSVKITNDSAGAQLIRIDLNNINLDLDTLSNGEASPDTDFLYLAVRPSDVNMISAGDSAFAYRFFDNATAGSGNENRYNVGDEITLSDWNFIPIKKNTSSPSSGDLSAVQSIRIQFNVEAGYQNETVNFQLIQLVKADPIDPNIPNPFQKNGERVALPNTDIYVGPEFGENVIKQLDNSLVVINAIEFTKQFDDFIAGSRLSSSATNLWGLVWWVDPQNYVSLVIEGSSFRLRVREGGVNSDETKILSYTANTKLSLTLEKDGANLIGKLSTGEEIKNTTTLSGGVLALPVRVGDFSTYNSAFITELPFAARAGVADVARSLEEQPFIDVSLNSIQSIPTGAITRLEFDLVDDDNGRIINDGAGTYTITESGIYIITASVNWESNSNGDRTLLIGVNTVYEKANRVPPVVGDTTRQEISIVLRLKKGDDIDINCQQDSGIPLDATPQNRYTSLQILKIG